MADTLTVANRFLTLARDRGETLTPMQILKLVYIAHGWTLGLYHRPLINDDIQAWQYGPVIPRLYSALRHFRSQPVNHVPGVNQTELLQPQDENIIGQVFGLYGHMSGPALSRLTHSEGTPWHLTYQPAVFGIAIPDDIIEDHYAGLANVRTARS